MEGLMNIITKLEKLLKNTEYVDAPLHYNSCEAWAWESGFQSFRSLLEEVLSGSDPKIAFRYK